MGNDLHQHPFSLFDDDNDVKREKKFNHNSINIKNENEITLPLPLILVEDNHVRDPKRKMK